jgi:hypothetical protein
MGADILAMVERRWSKRHHELGPCLVWREGEPTVQAATGVYGRIYDPAIKRSDWRTWWCGGACTGQFRGGLTASRSRSTTSATSRYASGPITCRC